MKKRISLFICMLVCVFAMSGCGEKTKNPVINNDATLEQYTVGVFGLVELLVDQGMDGVNWDLMTGEDFVPAYTFPYYVQVKATASYKEVLDKVGEFIEIKDNYKITYKEDEIIVSVGIDGEKRDAQMEVIFETEMPDIITISSFSINEDYTFAEKMGNAGLNTLLGMGTVFIVLILISVVISLFGFIPKLTAKKAAKKAKANDNDTAMDNAIAQIAEKEEGELSDDLELVAVITAAINAYEGTSSTNGFVVRSIKKSNSKKWQNAAPQA